MADQGRKLGKVAVVTGAVMGIGQAYAKRLAEDGADIAIADIVPATETEDLVRGLGRKVKTMQYLAEFQYISKPSGDEHLSDAPVLALCSSSTTNTLDSALLRLSPDADT